MSCATTGTYRDKNNSHVQHQQTEKAKKYKPPKPRRSRQILAEILLLPLYIVLYAGCLFLQMAVH